MSHVRNFAVAGAVLLALVAPVADAGQGTASLEVSANVNAECRMSFTALNFGAYDPLGAHSQQNLDATATMLLTCTKGAGASVSLDGGRNASANGTRSLWAAGQLVAYQIYRDSARTQVWGTANDALQFSPSLGIAYPASVTVYGRIPGGQEAVAGIYSDLVTATVDF